MQTWCAARLATGEEWCPPTPVDTGGCVGGSFNCTVYPSAVLVLPEAGRWNDVESWQKDLNEHIRSRIN